MGGAETAELMTGEHKLCASGFFLSVFFAGWSCRRNKVERDESDSDHRMLPIFRMD